MPRWDAVGFFCEDIRREMNNVDTLVGVMTDNVAIEGPTGGVIPKLGMYARIHLTLDVDVDDVSVRADFFDGLGTQMLGSFSRDQIEAEKEGVRRNGGSILGFVVRALISPFPVPRYGRVLLKARVGNEEIICGGLNFVPGATSPNASPPPSEQSPSAS